MQKLPTVKVLNNPLSYGSLSCAHYTCSTTILCYCIPHFSPAVVVIEVVDEEDGEEGLVVVVVDLVTVLVTVEPALVAVSLHLLQEEVEETKRKVGRETIY